MGTGKNDGADAKVRESVLDIFSSVASSLGYSELHGRIMGVLYLEKDPVSLQELARRTNYSLSTISLSIDFLEVLGVIKKGRQNADRKVYVTLVGSLFDTLKRAVLVKLERSVNESLSSLERQKSQVSDKKLAGTLDELEREIKKVRAFIDLVNKRT